MTNSLKEKLLKKMNTGTKQERKICQELLENKELKLKNLEDFSNHFKCSNSSVTRLTRSLKFPSFPHFYHELYSGISEELKHYNNDLIWYANEAKKIANLIMGQIYIFSSRRGKSIAKFFTERLNTIGIKNEYFHETWGRSHDDQMNRVKKNDTVIIITMNASSNLANKYIDKAIESKNIKKIIILTANSKIKRHNKIYLVSLAEIDNMNYEVETFDGYNYASSRMIGFLVSLMKYMYGNLKNSLIQL